MTGDWEHVTAAGLLAGAARAEGAARLRLRSALVRWMLTERAVAEAGTLCYNRRNSDQVKIMAGWSENVAVPGTTRFTFRADPAKMPPAVLAAVEMSAYWEKCADGMFYQNSGFFEGKVGICEEMAGGGALPAPEPRLVSFVSIYGPEPGPYAAKYVWEQAFRTFVDDMLPAGLTRAGATEITKKIRPYGLPGVRFFRLQRRELMIDRPTPVDNTSHRVVFVHQASMTRLRYLDYPAWQVMSDEFLDDVVTDWQAAVVQEDPASFPKDAVPSPRHNPFIMDLIEKAQAA